MPPLVCYAPWPTLGHDRTETIRTEMPNARKKTKTFKGAWLEEETIEKLKTISDSLGINFTTLLEKIASGEFTITRKENSDEENH